MKKTIILLVPIILIVALSLYFSAVKENPIYNNGSDIVIVKGNEEKACPFCKVDQVKATTLQNNNTELPMKKDLKLQTRKAFDKYINQTKIALRVDSVECDRAECKVYVSKKFEIIENGEPFYKSGTFKNEILVDGAETIEAKVNSDNKSYEFIIKYESDV